MTRTTASVYIPGLASPIALIERAEARELVWEGHAQWKNRCNDIVMLRTGYDLRGSSCYGRLQPHLMAQAYSVSELKFRAA